MSLRAIFMLVFGVALALGAPALGIASKPVLGVALTFFFPPMLFVVNVCRGRVQSLIRLLSLLAITYCSMAVVWMLHCLEAYLGDWTTPWMLAVRSAGVLYFLPVFFIFIQPPMADEQGEGEGNLPEAEEAVREEVEEDEGVVDDDEERDARHIEWSSIDLPGSAVLQFGTTRGTLLHAALRDKECREAADAYARYALLTYCTVVSVAVNVCAGLVPLESALAYLSIASLVSLIHGYALFIFPGLNTRLALPVLLMLVPTALTVTTLVHMIQGVEMKRMDELACWLRDGLLTAFIPLATLTMVGTMRREE